MGSRLCSESGVGVSFCWVVDSWRGQASNVYPRINMEGTSKLPLIENDMPQSVAKHPWHSVETIIVGDNLPVNSHPTRAICR